MVTHGIFSRGTNTRVQVRNRFHKYLVFCNEKYFETRGEAQYLIVRYNKLLLLCHGIHFYYLLQVVR